MSPNHANIWVSDTATRCCLTTSACSQARAATLAALPYPPRTSAPSISRIHPPRDKSSGNNMLTRRCLIDYPHIDRVFFYWHGCVYHWSCGSGRGRTELHNFARTRVRSAVRRLWDRSHCVGLSNGIKSLSAPFWIVTTQTERRIHAFEKTLGAFVMLCRGLVLGS